MDFRENDVVVSTCDITCRVTGRSVSRGAQGVVLKQSGWRPASFKVRFAVPGHGTGSGTVTGSVVLDGITARELARSGASLGDPFEGEPATAGNPGTAADPWWTARDPLAGSPS